MRSSASTPRKCMSPHRIARSRSWRMESELKSWGEMSTRFYIIAVLLLGLLASGAAHADPPELSSIYPAGGQRGATVKVTFSGSELSKVTGFYTTGAGLTAKIEPLAKGADGSSRTVEIAVASDAPLGIRQVRLYSDSDIS